MFCTQCGAHVQDGAHFCENCGAALQALGAVSHDSPAPAAPQTGRRTSKVQDPYEQQIKQIKLQLRQLKLDLKQVNTGMGRIRSRYNQSAAFVPRGMFRRGYKEIEDVRLWGPQKQKQELQQQIIQLEQQLLALQQEQARWQG